MTETLTVIDEQTYPLLASYSRVMTKPARPVLKREAEIKGILANLHRPEVSNVILLGEAGVGKTAIVETLATQFDALFLEIDVAKMSGQGANILASSLKHLVDEVQAYQKEHDRTLVMFFDEFHQLVQLSEAAVEAVKPLLARSGALNIRIIAATTLEEYTKYIQGNEALNQRLQRINILPPDRETVMSILRHMHATHGRGAPIDDTVYQAIYDMTERYMPSQQQPRKSILILDAMYGWQRATGAVLNVDLLRHVIYQSTNIKAWTVDVTRIGSYLAHHIKSQDLAIEQVMNRLYMSMARLVDDSKPQASFLFTGATGVGKTEMAKRMAVSIFGSEKAMIRFDMSEYALEHTLELFRETLTDRVWENPYSIILLDEIEKAHPTVTRLLLQVLDDGRLNNRFGRQVSFVNTYIVLTTNVAAEIYSRTAHYNSEADLRNYLSTILRALRDDKSFPTELINRFDTVVPFNPISDKSRYEIAIMELKKLAEEVQRKHKKRLNITLEDVRNRDGEIEVLGVPSYIVHEQGSRDTNMGGGRGVKRVINSDITPKISRFILMHPEVENLLVRVAGDSRVANKHQLESRAYIEVCKYVKR